MRGSSRPDELPPVGLRGTRLHRKDIARIRRIVQRRDDQTRQEIAREVCRQLGWRRPNGAWAIRGARQLLVRLERLGLICLPAPRRPQGRPWGKAVETAVAALSPTAVAGTEWLAEQRSASGLLLVRPIGPSELLAWRACMERFHYLGDGALVGESLRYVAELDGQVVALLSWGAASLRNAPRDRYIGWDEATRRANLHLVVNNARFLILPWCRRPNLASRVLGANLRRLCRDWEKVYGHPVVLAETFVDTSRFAGTCYRASNWIYVGQTKGWSKSGSAYRFHGQPKAVWLYPLRRDFKQQLCTVAGKGGGKEEFMVINMENLPLDGEGGLLQILRAIPDPRQRRGIRHKIWSILGTAICAVMAGARSFTAIAEWAAEQSKETLRRLGSKFGRPPSERTYRRVLQSIDVEKLDRMTGGWIAKQKQLLAGMGLAVDGKTLRGSTDGDHPAVHLLSAIVHGSGTVVAQVAVESTTNETTKVEPLLDGLDIEGVVVTGDALLTQRDIARHIVEDKGADYVLTVKRNQPALHKEIKDFFDDKEEEAKRLQRAQNKPPQEAFPPSGQDD